MYKRRTAYTAPRRTAYRGRGDYRSTLRSVGKWGTRLAGAAYGAARGASRAGIPGAIRGAMRGYASGARTSRMLGFGDYRSAPPINNQIMQGSGQAPLSVNAPNNSSGDLTFAHSEFITNVYVGGTAGTASLFSNQTYSINPGLFQTFPWFSQVAENFTLYEPQGMIFEYRPTSGEFGSSASNALGKIIMVTNYDPDAPAFTSSVQAENYDYATSCKPSIGMRHGVECKRKQRGADMLYVRTGTTTKDLVFTDLGLFQLITEGIQIGSGGQSLVGELWVHYKFRLSRAKLYGSIIDQTQFSDWLVSATGASSLVNGTTTYLSTQCPSPQWTLGSAGAAYGLSANSIGGTLSAQSGTQTQYTFPNWVKTGTFLIQVMTCRPNGSVFNSGSNAYIGGYTNCADITSQIFPNSTTLGGSFTNNAFSNQDQRVAVTHMITVTNPVPGLTANFSYYCPNGGAGDIHAFLVTSMNSTQFY